MSRSASPKYSPRSRGCFYLETLQVLLFDATAGGANEISRIVFSHSKIDSLKNVILDSALEDAVATARRMAKKMKVRVGKALVISNVHPERVLYDNIVRLGWRHSSAFGRMGKAGIGYGGGGDYRKKVLMEINPGLIEIQNKVYVTL